MEKFDDNTTRFDSYLNGTMNADERAAFDQELSQNADLKRKFDEHKLIIHAVQSTCSDADAEFERALRGISDEDFARILNQKSQAAPDVTTKPTAKMIPLRKVISWMSVAAVVLFVAGAALFQYQAVQNKNKLAQMQDKTCEAIFATGFYSDDASRGGSEEYDQAISMIETDTKSAIDILSKLYGETSDNELKLDSGIALAYAYIKAHDIANAKQIVAELKSNYGDTPEVQNLDKAMKLL